MKSIVPVEGFYINGVPHVEQEVSDADARHLVRSGAFIYKEPPPEGDDQEPAEQAGSSDSEES